MIGFSSLEFSNSFCKYIINMSGETANSIEQPERKCIAQDFAQLCDDRQCFSCNSFREADSQIVRGTILVRMLNLTLFTFLILIHYSGKTKDWVG